MEQNYQKSSKNLKVSHTPGPWIADGGNGKGQICLYKVRRDIDDVTFIGGIEFPIHDTKALTKEEAKANARLIASAPELLEALEELTDILEGIIDEHIDVIKDHADSFTLQTAKKAIAKATGETINQ